MAIEINRSYGKPTYIVDLDIQKAYDSVDRNNVNDLLRKKGVPKNTRILW